jgi:hypothetical protein
LPENVEIVPVVYITIEALRLMQHSATYIAHLQGNDKKADQYIDYHFERQEFAYLEERVWYE